MSVRSLRELAEKLNLSHATVSSALRGSPLVKESTRLRVLEAAEQLGYRGNPLASALMAEMRRSRGGVFRGLLVILDPDRPGLRPAFAAGYHKELTAGAVQRAAELGFSTDLISVDTNGQSWSRLPEVFRTRNVRGVFVLPSLVRPDLQALDWSRLSGIYADQPPTRATLHAVCPDHHRAMVLALDELYGLGYRRPGLLVDSTIDARLLHRWEAAYHAYFSDASKVRPPAPLVVDRPDEKAFARWFEQGGFDVVLGHDPVVVDWMRAAGVEVPETAGFCCLNLANSPVPCAGLDLRPQAIGRHGMDLLTAQVMRNETGAVELPTVTLVPANWVAGSTVRAASSQPAAECVA